MNKIVLIVTYIAMGVITFHLGGNWESYMIHNQIKENGFAVSKWGESDETEFKIVGKIEN